MSKRAEGLVKRIRETERKQDWDEETCSETDADYPLLSDDAAAALIDAELRDDRERCADRAVGWYSDMGIDIDDRTDDNLRSAILADPDDTEVKA